MGNDAPLIGTINYFYCNCVNNTNIKNTETKEHNFFNSKKSVEYSHTYSSPSSPWICKSVWGGDYINEPLFFGKKVIINYHYYYWECMSCGKKTGIGIWDNYNRAHGNSLPHCTVKPKLLSSFLDLFR